jgi:hypothetical protein
MKPSKHADEATLRKIIAAMPEPTAKIVREAAKKHGLLPGGGKDEPKGKKP